MYTIIGGDGREYGPVTADDLCKWIAEERLNAQSLIKGEGDAEFRPASAFPEFADVLRAQAATTETSPSSVAADWLERDYELDIGGCITRGWELVKKNFGVLFVGALVYTLIQGAIGGLAQIPLVGPLFQIVNLFIAGPMMAGVFYTFLRAIRREPATVSDIFTGFRRSYLQLFLGTVVQGLLICACMLPFIVVFVVKFIPLIGQLHQLQPGTPPSTETITTIKSVLLTSLPFFLVCIIPATYFAVGWKFTLPLIIDRQMNFWDAMGASRKMVNKHWWLVFGLLLVIGLINAAGFLACCVGVLFTAPIGIAALMYAYETIFNAKKA